MEQSLIAAVSGIEANQTYLDVIGNNIANSDTTGYKAEDPIFTDLLAEQIAGASAPSAGQSAGVDPIAVGAGVRVGAVTNDQSQGAIQQTNQPTDVAIQGAGFLIADREGQQYYTRAGNLTLDANGDLATPTGALIQGWQADGQGAIDTNAPVGVGGHPQRPGDERPGDQLLHHGREPPGVERERARHRWSPPH